MIEVLDYIRDEFIEKRHIHRKWPGSGCEIKASVPAQVIDRASSPRLLAWVMVDKRADHLSLCRQDSIFARAGMSLAQWVGTWGVQS